MYISRLGHKVVFINVFDKNDVYITYVWYNLVPKNSLLVQKGKVNKKSW